MAFQFLTEVMLVIAANVLFANEEGALDKNLARANYQAMQCSRLKVAV